ncbi:MAG: hypothetical protein WCJ64_07135 [Rhodospirillaceae bacterium]
MRNPLDVSCFNEIGLPNGKDAGRLQELLMTPSIVHTLLETYTTPNLRFDILMSRLSNSRDFHRYNIWAACPERIPYVAAAILAIISTREYLYDFNQHSGIGTWPDLPLEIWYKLVDLNKEKIIKDIANNPATPADILRRLTTIKPPLSDDEIKKGASESWQEGYYREHRYQAVCALSKKDPTVPVPEITNWDTAREIATHPNAHPLHLAQCIERAFSQQSVDNFCKVDAYLISNVLNNANTPLELKLTTCKRIKEMFERFAERGGGIGQLGYLLSIIQFYNSIIDYIGLRLVYRLFQLDLPEMFERIYLYLSTVDGGAVEEVEACWATPPMPLFTAEPYKYGELGLGLPQTVRDDDDIMGDARLVPMRPHEEIKHLLALHPKASNAIVAEAETNAPDDIKKIIAQYRYDGRARKARGELLDNWTDAKKPLDPAESDRLRAAYPVHLDSFRAGALPLCINRTEFEQVKRFAKAGCDISELVMLNIEKMKVMGEGGYYDITLAQVLALARMQPAVYQASAAYALKGGRLAGELTLNRLMPLSILEQDDPCFDGLTSDYLKEFGLEEAVRRLATEGHLETRVIIARNAHTPSDVLAVLARDSAMIVRKAVAENPNASPETLATLALDTVPGVRRRARGNPALPQDVADDDETDRESWEETWEAPYPDPRLWGQALLSWLPETPPTLLGELAVSPHFVLRESALRNPKTPVEFLKDAAGSADAAIRAAVAANPACPPAVQRKLAQSPEWYVRWELARNEKAAPDVLLTLIETGDWKIWEEIANHPSLSKRTLADLEIGESAPLVVEKGLDPELALAHEWHLLDQVAKQTDGNQAAIFAALYRTGHPKVLDILAGKQNVPPDIEIEIAARQSPITYLCHLARTQPLTEETAIAFARDFRMIVRRALAQNSTLPLAAQQILANDESPRVLRVLAQSECLQPKIYMTLAVRQIDGKDDYGTLTNLARNPALPFEVTDRLSQHSHEQVRARVAARRDLSPELIVRLHADEASVVVKAIKTNQQNQYGGYRYIEMIDCLTGIACYEHPYTALIRHYKDDDDPPELDVSHKFRSPFFLDHG